nr:MFS transporter [Streptomyces sp. TLI_105]
MTETAPHAGTPAAQPVTETAPRAGVPAQAQAPAPAYTPTAPAHRVPVASPRRRGGLAVIVLAQLAVLLGVTRDPFDLSGESPQSYAFAVPFAALLLLGGHLVDRVGGRRTLVVGLSGLVGACVLGGSAGEFAPAALIAARVLQGGFGALVTVAAPALVATVFPEPKARVRAFGVYATVAVGGPAVGASTGLMGRGPVLVVIALLALIALAGSRVLPHDRPDRPGARFDLPGVLLGGFGVALLLYGSVKAAPGWGTPLVLGLVAGGAVLLAAFLGRQGAGSNPLLPPSVLKDRSRLGGFLTMLLAGAGILALLPPLAFILMMNLGFSVSTTGLAMLPMVAAIAAGAVEISPRLLARGVAPRVLLVSGLVVTPLGLALTITGIESGGGYAALLPAMLLAGLGIGLAFMPLFAVVVDTGLGRHTGVASAAVVTAQTVGAGFGTALYASQGGPPWWAVLFLLAAGLTGGLMVTAPSPVSPRR